MDKKFYKNLLFPRNPLNILLQNFHWETHIDSAYLHVQNQEFCAIFLWVNTETTSRRNF